MNFHVEIEFSANLDTPKDQLQTFHVLQIHPVVETEEKNR